MSIKIGFDIGGVLSKYPSIFRPLIDALIKGGAEVHVITDMHERSETLEMLRLNGLGDIPPERVHNSDFERYGEACKAVLLKQLGVDIFIDDFPAYLAGGCPVRLQVLPDIDRPYYADEWKTSGKEGEFGRRKRVEAYLKEGQV